MASYCMATQHRRIMWRTPLALGKYAHTASHFPCFTLLLMRNSFVLLSLGMSFAREETLTLDPPPASRHPSRLAHGWSCIVDDTKLRWYSSRNRFDFVG